MTPTIRPTRNTAATSATSRVDKYYFGLKKGESILVSIPLVFWNGARIGIGTDGKYLTPTRDPNPLHTIQLATLHHQRRDQWRHDPERRRDVVSGRDSLEAPNDDAEDQLAEWTIRDHDYLVNPQITRKTNSEIPDNQLVTLINYDVSNVDNLYLPLAMEANDVWVVPQKSGNRRIRTGLAGAGDGSRCLWLDRRHQHDRLSADQSRNSPPTTTSSWDSISAAKGWPFYNIPNPTNDPNAPRKIPVRRQHLRAEPTQGSPLQLWRWTMAERQIHALERWHGADQGTIGWAGGTRINPREARPASQPRRGRQNRSFLIKVGYLVRVGPPESHVPIPFKTAPPFLEIHRARGGIHVTLSKPLVASSETCAFEFTRPVDDYASDAMIRLWYSWAQYYLAHWKDRRRRPHGADADRRIHREEYGDADLQRSASRVGRGHGGNGPRSGRRHDRVGHPSG